MSGITPRRPKRLKPIKHGTGGGYQAHRRRNERSCAACLAGHSAEQLRYVKRVVAERPEIIRHGTYGGYQFCRHAADGACSPCKKAAAEYDASRKARLAQIPMAERVLLPCERCGTNWSAQAVCAVCVTAAAQVEGDDQARRAS